MREDQDHGSDRQITEAYARLRTALAPPPDLAVRVERRVAVRRRRRRTTGAGAAVLLMAGAVGGAVVLRGGGGPDGDQVATETSDPPPAAHGGSFTLTRPDGSQAVVGDLTLSCERTPQGQPAEPGHIYLWSPVHLDASGDRLTEPYVSFDALAPQADGTDYTLPVDDTAADRRYPVVLLYAADAGGTKQQSNEVSSAADGASGTIRVLQASCAETPTLEVEVDTTLGSEVHQGSLEVSGSYR